MERQKVNLAVNESIDPEPPVSVVAESEPRPRLRKQRTPFVIFMAENSEKYKNLGKNFLKEIGRIWSELDEDVKKVYIDKARAERDALVADMSDVQGSVVLMPRSKFPVARVKNVLKEDARLYKKVRPETFEYIAEIVDVFSEELLADAFGLCRKAGKRKIGEGVFDDVRKKNYKYRFLSDIRLGEKDTKKSGVGADKRNGQDDEEADEHVDEQVGEQVDEDADAQKTQLNPRNTIANYFKIN